MRNSCISLARRVGLVALAAITLTSTAGAQGVQAKFYGTFGGSTNPNAPFNGGPVICSAIIGSTVGFFLNFSDPAVRAMLCPSNPDAINPAFRIFAARFTGTILASSAGVFDLGHSADDGNVLAVNGTIYDYEWNAVKGGGPGSVTVNLNAGQNDFVVDYNNSWFGGGHVRLLSPDVEEVQFVTPEPSSIVLMASGLAALAGVARRRRKHA